jgi:hypothetical protein
MTVRRQNAQINEKQCPSRCSHHDHPGHGREGMVWRVEDHDEGGTNLKRRVKTLADPSRRSW